MPPLDTDQPQHVIFDDPTLQAGFTTLSNIVLRSRVLSPFAKALYALLASYAWQSDSCFPGYARLMDDLGCNVKTLIKHIRELESYGLLEKRESEPGKWTYVLKDVEV